MDNDSEVFISAKCDGMGGFGAYMKNDNALNFLNEIQKHVRTDNVEKNSNGRVMKNASSDTITNMLNFLSTNKSYGMKVITSSKDFNAELKELGQVEEMIPYLYKDGISYTHRVWMDISNASYTLRLSVENSNNSRSQLIVFIGFILMKDMEPVDVVKMAADVAKGTPLTYTDVIEALTTRFFAPIQGQLTKMHNMSKFHRDIKQENIMMYKDGTGKYMATLIDFGLMGSGIGGGTRYFMSPAYLDYGNRSTPAGVTPTEKDIMTLVVNNSKQMNGIPFMLSSMLPGSAFVGMSYVSYFRYALETFYKTTTTATDTLENRKHAELANILKRNDYYALGLAIAELWQPQLPKLQEPQSAKDPISNWNNYVLCTNIYRNSTLTKIYKVNLKNGLTINAARNANANAISNRHLSPDVINGIYDLEAEWMKRNATGGRKGGALANEKRKILGRMRTIRKKGRSYYITYQGQDMLLRDAKALEAKLKKKSSKVVPSKTKQTKA